ncbi:uncharacterized protein [Leptinotarsa decemlineata]|uniref:uncharacterized protein n=1 Tax=Leptinotarsa decemlineata TaxID=7539 RepID=UPI003D30BE08
MCRLSILQSPVPVKMSTTRIFTVFLIVVVTLISDIYCAPPNSSNITVKDFCIKETKIAKEKVDEIEKNPDAGTDDEEVLCYTHCVMVTLGVIDEDGAIAVEKFKKFFDGFDMECVKKIPKIENCTDLSALDDCEEE